MGPFLTNSVSSLNEIGDLVLELLDYSYKDDLSHPKTVPKFLYRIRRVGGEIVLHHSPKDILLLRSRFGNLPLGDPPCLGRTSNNNPLKIVNASSVKSSSDVATVKSMQNDRIKLVETSCPSSSNRNTNALLEHAFSLYAINYPF
jgi:hypothetical protein